MGGHLKCELVTWKVMIYLASFVSLGACPFSTDVA